MNPPPSGSGTKPKSSRQSRSRTRRGPYAPDALSRPGPSGTNPWSKPGPSGINAGSEPGPSGTNALSRPDHSTANTSISELSYPTESATSQSENMDEDVAAGFWVFQPNDPVGNNEVSNNPMRESPPLHVGCVIQNRISTTYADCVKNGEEAKERLYRKMNSTIRKVREAIKKEETIFETFRDNVSVCTSEVRALTQRSIELMYTREKQLLEAIKLIRDYKTKELVTDYYNLHCILARLSIFTEFLDRCNNLSDPFEVITLNNQAARMLQQVHDLCHKVVSAQSVTLQFEPPGNDFLSSISSFGNLVVATENRNRNSLHHPIIIKFCTSQTLMFGVPGHNDGELFDPWGICCDVEGNIIISDQCNNRIQMFNSIGIFLHNFGSEGNLPGQFRNPVGVAINSMGRIVVADRNNHRIQIFSREGEFLLTFGELGNEAGQFNLPWGVACDSTDRIVVSDTGNNRIQLFNSEGVFLLQYGFTLCSTQWRQFCSPRGVCFTPQGYVITVDFNQARLIAVSPGFNSSFCFGTSSGQAALLTRPEGVASDDEGNVVVTDSVKDRIVVFDSTGNFKWKLERTQTTLMSVCKPLGVCINHLGRIVIIQGKKPCVHIF